MCVCTYSSYVYNYKYILSYVTVYYIRVIYIAIVIALRELRVIYNLITIVHKAIMPKDVNSTEQTKYTDLRIIFVINHYDEQLRFHGSLITRQCIYSKN